MREPMPEARPDPRRDSRLGCPSGAKPSAKVQNFVRGIELAVRPYSVTTMFNVAEFVVP